MFVATYVRLYLMMPHSPLSVAEVVRLPKYGILEVTISFLRSKSTSRGRQRILIKRPLLVLQR